MSVSNLVPTNVLTTAGYIQTEAPALPKAARVDPAAKVQTANLDAFIQPKKSTKTVAPAITDINDLVKMSSTELTKLFAEGHDVDEKAFRGEMRGVKLEIPHHDGDGLDRFADKLMATLHPWAGKNALTPPVGAEEGSGKNRIFGKLLLPFRFKATKTAFAGDLLGKDAKVIRLDYAAPKSLLNRLLGIGHIHDEMREVGPKGSGVYLGMAGLRDRGPVWTAIYNGLLKLAGREERLTKNGPPVPVIFFALQAHPEKAG
ncbi:MAG: hypothetical protein U1E65_35600 [Myxococcota bacterium]